MYLQKTLAFQLKHVILAFSFCMCSGWGCDEPHISMSIMFGFRSLWRRHWQAHLLTRHPEGPWYIYFSSCVWEQAPTTSMWLDLYAIRWFFTPLMGADSELYTANWGLRKVTSEDLRKWKFFATWPNWSGDWTCHLGICPWPGIVTLHASASALPLSHRSQGQKLFLNSFLTLYFVPHQFMKNSTESLSLVKSTHDGGCCRLKC